LVSCTLTSNGLRSSISEFDCEEKSKVYVVTLDSAFKDYKHLKKDKINDPYSNIINRPTIISYSCWCHIDEIQEQSDIVKQEVIKEAYKIKEQINGLLKIIES
jgi:hypothetical protein